MNAVLVRQGEKYSPAYVSMLRSMLTEFYGKEPVTLTDQSNTPGLTVPLRHRLPGWWSKLELFAPENEDLRPLLYIDLDSYVLGDISFIREPERFSILREWLGKGKTQSSVMLLPKDTSGIWAEFDRQKDKVMNDPRGDQWFLSRFPHDVIQDLYPDLAGSYKVHNREKPVNRIITFHGRPKCHEADGWARDVWLTYHPPNS